ncbi:MAG: FAD-dependent oxidoreductase [Candidatus Undinarchaeales archaeon]|nr:FAD-dependent oxidoreductase [Candidatus Undinarchaeales archaeon]MDP7493356.1 FAD-dependent oxidoreductase [Candidatus Undinarchaeales archaeon]
MNQSEVLILGAGPAGMAAAFELSKAQRTSTVIERNECVGGLARTIQHGDFRTDIGPHRFISQDRKLYELIEGLLGRRWAKVDRITHFIIGGRFFRYPIDVRNALVNVGPFKAIRFLLDYLYEGIKPLFVERECRSFEDYAVSNFGRGLAELNILNYTEKTWGLPCSEISPDWARQRIKGLSIPSIVKKAIMGSGSGPKTLVDQFHYPDTGTGAIYEAMKERVLGEGHCEILTNAHPIEISYDGHGLVGIAVDVNGTIKRFRPDHVISSIPLPELIGLLEPEPPANVVEAAGKLRFRSHVSLFITLDKSSVFPDQWIYFPDKNIPFGRIMEPRNFSGKMAPPNKTSLLIEFFCWEDDEIWNADSERLLELSAKWLEELTSIRMDEVIDSFVHKERHAYPVYDLGYRKHLDTVNEYLGRFKNLQSIGRGGCFRYNNQDHALAMGALAARSIIEGRRFNIEDVGTEDEYLEADPVPGRTDP